MIGNDGVINDGRLEIAIQGHGAKDNGNCVVCVRRSKERGNKIRGLVVFET